MVPIAIDAMGGDYAPPSVVEGVCEALDVFRVPDRFFLVGDRARLEPELERLGKASDPRIEIVHTDQVIDMHESPTAAIRAKRRSSISVAVGLVKDGTCRGLISAGHTGAAVACAVLQLRPLPGIARPAIAAVLPTPAGPVLLLDAGANVDCKTRHLVQFAVMGEIYAREILGIATPRIGLLNVGDEEGKGNDLTKETYREIATVKGLGFLGNVEGRDLFAGRVDVVVCDGFVGNVVLKCCESLAGAFGQFLKTLLTRNVTRRVGALLARNAFREFKELSDYAEYGGAPLLGVNGVCIIGHGSSSPLAIRNAVRVAGEAVEHRLNEHIVERIKQLGLIG